MAIWQFGCMVIPKGRELNKFTEKQLISWRSISLSVNTSEFIDYVLPVTKKRGM